MTDSDGDLDSDPQHDADRVQTRRLRVTFLDVAQGDATLIRFPDGRAWLVDTGGALGRFDIGTRIVSPALWALGLRRLSTLVLTHGDRDHIGGAHAMLRDFRPAEVWEGVPVDGHAETTRLRDEAIHGTAHDGAPCRSGERTAWTKPAAASRRGTYRHSCVDRTDGREAEHSEQADGGRWRSRQRAR